MEGHANYFYECNDIHEKNINKAIDTFVKQLKDSKEAHRKEINSLQLKEEKLEKEKSQKFEDNNSQQKMANGKSEHSTSGSCEVKFIDTPWSMVIIITSMFQITLS